MVAGVVRYNRFLGGSCQPSIKNFQMITVEFEELSANLCSAYFFFADMLTNTCFEIGSRGCPAGANRLVWMPDMMHLVKDISKFLIA